MGNVEGTPLAPCCVADGGAASPANHKQASSSDEEPSRPTRRSSRSRNRRDRRRRHHRKDDSDNQRSSDSSSETSSETSSDEEERARKARKARRKAEGKANRPGSDRGAAGMTTKGRSGQRRRRPDLAPRESGMAFESEDDQESVAMPRCKAESYSRSDSDDDPQLFYNRATPPSTGQKVRERTVQPPAPSQAISLDEAEENKQPQEESESIAAYRVSVARYANMNLVQLRKMCSQSWLSEEGSEEEMRQRLVEYDAAAEGWEIPRQIHSPITSDDTRTDLEDISLASSGEDDDMPLIPSNSIPASVGRSDGTESSLQGSSSRYTDVRAGPTSMATPRRPPTKLRSEANSDSRRMGGRREPGLRVMPSLTIEVDNPESPSKPASATPRPTAHNSSSSRLSIEPVPEERELVKQRDVDDGNYEQGSGQAEEWLHSRGFDAAAVQLIRSKFHASGIVFDVKSLRGLSFDELSQYSDSTEPFESGSPRSMQRKTTTDRDDADEVSEDEDVELFSSPPRSQLFANNERSLVTPPRRRHDDEQETADDVAVRSTNNRERTQVEPSLQPPSSPRLRQAAGTGVLHGRPGVPRTLSPMEEYAASLRDREPSYNANSRARQPGTQLSASADAGSSVGGKGFGGSRRWGRLKDGLSKGSTSGTTSGGVEEDDEDVAAREQAAALRARLIAERGIKTGGNAHSSGDEVARLSVVQRSGAAKRPPQVPAEVRAALLSTPPRRRSPNPSSGVDQRHSTSPPQTRDEELRQQREQDETDDIASLASRYFAQFDVDSDGRLSIQTELGAALNSAYPELGLEAAELEELRAEAEAEIPSDDVEMHSAGLNLEQFEFLIVGFASEMGPPQPVRRRTSSSSGTRREMKRASPSGQSKQRYISTTVLNDFNV